MKRGKFLNFFKSSKRRTHTVITMGCLNTLHPLLSRKSFQQFDIFSLTSAIFLPPEHTAWPRSSLKFQTEDYEVTAFELRWNIRSNQLTPSWYGKYLSLLTTWRYLGCIHKHDLIGTHTAKRYSICVSRISNFYLFIKEKDSVITHLMSHKTLTLAPPVSCMASFCKIAANSAKLLKPVTYSRIF